MKIVKPRNLEEYGKWLQEYHGFIIDKKIENHYNSIASKIKNDFENSNVWTAIISRMQDINNEYLSQTGYQLFINEFKPILVTKTFNSFLEKSFRKNVVFNKNWIIDDKPVPPSGGWITPNNWIEKTNDILRTYFVVKYLDGVETLMQKIIEIFKENLLEYNKTFEARDEGYYAVHVYTNYNFEIPKITWDTENKIISVEIQITTQLQDVISKLTHKYYENRRICMEKSDKKWQWKYDSEEFTVNYLGHILHYLEGMIMEVRQKQK